MLEQAENELRLSQVEFDRQVLHCIVSALLQTIYIHMILNII